MSTTDPRKAGPQPPFPEQRQPSPGEDRAVRLSSRRSIEETVERFGRIDVLVNNAAYQGESVSSFDEILPFDPSPPLIVQSFGAEKVGHFGASNPMERPAQPAELAPAYVFLACDESRFVTGEVIGVTGGRRLV